MTQCAQLPAHAWYLIQSKPRQEQHARENLERQGFECFLPCFQSPSRRPEKTGKTGLQPLFPGYLFIHLHAEDNWSKLRSTRGVSRVVSFDGSPCQVHQSIIDQLHTRNNFAQVNPELHPGQAVHIKEGPLANIDAIFLNMNGEQRVLLLMNALNRQHRIKLPLSYIRPAGA